MKTLNLKAAAAARVKRAKIMSKVMDRNENLLVNLYSRWLDEREYEDFQEYKDVIIKNLKLPKGGKVLSVNKRFHIDISLPEFKSKVTMKVTLNSISWSLAV